MKRFAKKLYSYVINPPSDEALVKASEGVESLLPVIWLLGKTGAGKSSIVQKITGQTSAEIGNGFMPCTKDSRYYDYPTQLPILRFLDTRGLGEVSYDPGDDLQSLSNSSHALLLVMRIRDGEQSAVLAALKQIKSSARHIRSADITVVHTGLDEIADEHDRLRAIALKQQAVEELWGNPLDYCAVDLSAQQLAQLEDDAGSAKLKQLLAEKLPQLSLWLQKSQHKDAEQRNYSRLSSEVLWYAGIAAASDTIPLVGLVSVPAIQGKMLHSLAQKYDVQWNARDFSEFIAALGSSFALRYAVSLGGRQLGKLIPGYGQMVGTVFAVSVSYATTYALGRAACKYLYHRSSGTPMNEASLQAVYKEAIVDGRRAGRDVAKETNREEQI